MLVFFRLVNNTIAENYHSIVVGRRVFTKPSQGHLAACQTFHPKKIMAFLYYEVWYMSCLPATPLGRPLFIMLDSCLYLSGIFANITTTRLQKDHTWCNIVFWYLKNGTYIPIFLAAAMGLVGHLHKLESSAMIQTKFLTWPKVLTSLRVRC